MPAGINITIAANAQAAQRSLQGFGRYAEGLGKVLEKVFGRGAAATTGAANMSRALQQLQRQTQEYTQRLQVLHATLQQVQKQQQAAMASGPGGAAQAKALDLQTKQLQRQIASASARVANLQAMQQTVQSGQVPAGMGVAAGAPGQKPPGLPNLNSMLGYVKGGAASRGLALGGPLGALAGVAIGTLIEQAVKMGIDSVRPAIEHQMQVADIMPRILGTGNLQNADAASRGMRMMGLPLGYNAQESLSAMATMSTGGGKFPQLAQDTRSVMQFSRMFGLDVGSQASTFAEAQKMGAFKAGDAKRFANLLAQEIARSGLGPRAEEVQQATLMLLNTAMRTQAEAKPGGLMGRQALFNRTGIPAFQGMRGAGIIASMQEQFANPGSDAASALDQLVMRSMGITGYYKQQRFREKGFDDPRLFSQYLRVVRANTKRSPQEDELETVMFRQFPALTYSKMEALRKSTHGFRDITPGTVRSALGRPGVGQVERGAGAVMGMPGNQWHHIVAAIGEAQLRAGIPVVNHLAAIGDAVARAGQNTAEVADHAKGIKEGVRTLVTLSALGLVGLGAHAATSPPGQKLGNLAAGMGANLMLGIGNAVNALRGVLGLGSATTAGRNYMAPAEFVPFISEAAQRTGLDPALITALIHHESGFNPRARSKAGAYGLSQLMPGTAAGLGVNAKDPRQNIIGGATYLARQIKRFGSIELGLAAYNAGPGAVAKFHGIPPFRETQDYVPAIMTVYHVIQEAGVVSEQSKHAVKRAVSDAAQHHAQTQAKTQPNRVNRR